MFTLPPGYRPHKFLFFITYGASFTQAYADVGNDGVVNYDGGADSNGSIDNSDYVGLSNITFRADH
jgi:hypothetical protein